MVAGGSLHPGPHLLTSLSSSLMPWRSLPPGHKHPAAGESGQASSPPTRLDSLRLHCEDTPWPERACTASMRSSGGPQGWAGGHLGPAGGLLLYHVRDIVHLPAPLPSPPADVSVCPLRAGRKDTGVWGQILPLTE